MGRRPQRRCALVHRVRPIWRPPPKHPRHRRPAEVRFSSTHGFKGQEADAVILLDVTQRNYPLIHPTWTLFQVFGDTLQTLTEAERRLFYVGVSRPHLHLDVVTSNRDPSDFWTEARESNPVVQGEWDSLPEVRLPGGDRHVEVRVYNSSVEDFDTSKELLKRDRFRFRGGTAKYWWRLVPDHEWDRAPYSRHLGPASRRQESKHGGTVAATSNIGCPVDDNHGPVLIDLLSRLGRPQSDAGRTSAVKVVRRRGPRWLQLCSGRSVVLASATMCRGHAAAVVVVP